MTLLAVTLILTPLTWWTFRRPKPVAANAYLRALARLCTPAPTPAERDVPRPARATAQRAPVGEDEKFVRAPDMVLCPGCDMPNYAGTFARFCDCCDECDHGSVEL